MFYRMFYYSDTSYQVPYDMLLLVMGSILTVTCSTVHISFLVSSSTRWRRQAMVIEGLCHLLHPFSPPPLCKLPSCYRAHPRISILISRQVYSSDRILLGSTDSRIIQLFYTGKKYIHRGEMTRIRIYIRMYFIWEIH